MIRTIPTTTRTDPAGVWPGAAEAGSLGEGSLRSVGLLCERSERLLRDGGIGRNTARTELMPDKKKQFSVPMFGLLKSIRAQALGRHVRESCPGRGHTCRPLAAHQNFWRAEAGMSDSAGPGLSVAQERKFALRWADIRERFRLTDADLSEYERKRQERKGKSTNRPGLDPSVNAAKEWFEFLDTYWVDCAHSGCWHQFCSNSATHEQYAAQLKGVKQDVLAMLASIWLGHSDATDHWFENVCRPALEKALAALVTKRVAQARHQESTRIFPYSATAGVNSIGPMASAQAVGIPEAPAPGQAAARREKVKRSFGCEGKPPFVKFYKPLKVSNSEFHAWIREDHKHCGRCKWQALDRAADALV